MPASPATIDPPETYGLSYRRFVALWTRSLSPQAVLYLLIVLGYNGFIWFAFASRPDRVFDSTVSATLMIGVAVIGLLLLAFVIYGVYVHPYRTMEQAGPLAVDVGEDGVVVRGPSSSREYSWGSLTAVRSGDFVRLRAGRQWTPDFVPQELLAVDDLHERIAAGRAKASDPTTVSGDYELRVTVRDQLREWVRASTSTVGLSVLALTALLTAGSLWLAVEVDMAYRCLGFGLVAGGAYWIVMPLLSPLVIRSSPIRECTADVTEEGLRYRQSGYVETIPWKSVNRVRIAPDRVTVYIGQCGFLMRARDGAADPSVVIPASVKVAHSGRRGARQLALSIAAATVLGASVGFVLVAWTNPSLLSPEIWEQWGYRRVLGSFERAFIAGSVWAAVMIGLIALTSIMSRPKAAA